MKFTYSLKYRKMSEKCSERNSSTDRKAREIQTRRNIKNHNFKNSTKVATRNNATKNVARMTSESNYRHLSASQVPVRVRTPVPPNTAPVHYGAPSSTSTPILQHGARNAVDSGSLRLRSVMGNPIPTPSEVGMGLEIECRNGVGMGMEI